MFNDTLSVSCNLFRTSKFLLFVTVIGRECRHRTTIEATKLQLPEILKTVSTGGLKFQMPEFLSILTACSVQIANSWWITLFLYLIENRKPESSGVELKVVDLRFARKHPTKFYIYEETSRCDFPFCDCLTPNHYLSTVSSSVYLRQEYGLARMK